MDDGFTASGTGSMSDGARVRLRGPAAEWVLRFEEERRSVEDGLRLGGVPPEHYEIEHVGSTAVPGLGGKPVLDIALGLNDFDARVAEVERALQQHYVSSSRGHGRILLTRDGPPRVHLHLVALGAPSWTVFLAARDQLRGDPTLREEYWRFKLEAAARSRGNWRAYQAAKRAFLDPRQKPYFESLGLPGASLLAAAARTYDDGGGVVELPPPGDDHSEYEGSDGLTHYYVPPGNLWGPDSLGEQDGPDIWNPDGSRYRFYLDQSGQWQHWRLDIYPDGSMDWTELPFLST
jgi:GrpB-like predicted nucleotidyltransferase (UPF0157 family)